VEDSAGVCRGGSYYYDESFLRSSHGNARAGLDPSSEIADFGFRPVEVVPEPATMGLLAIGGAITLLVRMKQRL
jgi:hypothetical protein